MVRAVVNGMRAELHIEVKASNVPGYVDVITAGSRRGPFAVPNEDDWARVVREFCSQVQGAASSASPWGFALHLCGLVFPFGDVQLGGSSNGEATYSIVQRKLIDIWLQSRRSKTVDSAIDATARMVELGGLGSIN